MRSVAKHLGSRDVIRIIGKASKVPLRNDDRARSPKSYVCTRELSLLYFECQGGIPKKSSGYIDGEKYSERLRVLSYRHVNETKNRSRTWRINEYRGADASQPLLNCRVVSASLSLQARFEYQRMSHEAGPPQLRGSRLQQSTLSCIDCGVDV